jgi:pimeloyl-ACP methyl ester carboxylesterase
MRADYRLSELCSVGGLPVAQVTKMLESRGLADIGWSVYGRSSRLGPIADPAAWARASEAVVLLHGWAVTRRVWQTVAAAICRDNSQAVVLVPDVHGHGETRFSAAWPTRDHASIRSFMRGIIDWLELLGLRDFPSVLVGHSMSALGLLSITDEEIGPRVSRVIINPVWPHYDAKYRRRLYTGVLLGHTLARIKRFQPWIIRKMVVGAPAAQELPMAEREQMAGVVGAMTAGATARLVGSFRDAEPVPAPQHERMILMHGENDPLVSEEVLARALADLGLPADRVRRLATGGHYPHMESEAHPEYTARNCAEIVQLVDTMLLTAREGTMLSTQVESTMVGETTTAPAPLSSTLRGAPTKTDTR